ncbi:MAG: dihydroorotase [Bacteroidales bacterium]|nr:dihydroorotase [Bacteroidales bacterium]
MSIDTLISSATLINEGKIFQADVWIQGSHIHKIGSIAPEELPEGFQHIDGRGKYLIPGIIDEHVHFRDPGATHKGDMESESRAAVLGGITSYLDMPNNNPPAISRKALEEKLRLAQEKSWANFGFYLGLNNNNQEEAFQLDLHQHCGIKLFMGSSTGNMLVDREETLRTLFQDFPGVMALHCEDEQCIRQATEQAKEQYGDQIPFSQHPTIRSREACIRSTARAIALAEGGKAHVHLMHISTAEEVELIRKAKESNPQLTAETCPNYLWFDASQYEQLTYRLKCNPAIKASSDREALLKAVREGVLDTIGTDHAPHLLEEKQQNYLQSPSGMPSIQFSLPVMVELHLQGHFDLPTLVDRMCHAPARLYHIENRGYIRCGQFADLVLFSINPTDKQEVTTAKLAGKCGWSPYEGCHFATQIEYTWVNGQAVVANRQIQAIEKPGIPLTYER